MVFMQNNFTAFCARCAAALALLLLTVQCAGTGDGSGYNAVVIQDTDMREYGPEQTVPSVTPLSKGTRLKIISNSGGSSLATTVDGKTGFVPNADIGFAGGKQDESFSYSQGF